MLPNRAAPLYTAPLADLLVVLLRQLKRIFADQGIHLSDAEIYALAHDVVQKQASAAQTQPVQAALLKIIAESEAVLERWNLTFIQSLGTAMDAIPGWETTSDFLEIANAKVNAELRISTAAALLVALGDYRYGAYLLAAFDHASQEPEGIIARRVLLFASGVDGDAADWRVQLMAWIESQSRV